MEENFGFMFSHIGVNCEDNAEAQQQAALLTALFGLPAADGKDSVYSGSSIELMKGSGRGKNGHIAIATDDICKAMKALEEKGFKFVESSAKYDDDGKMKVIYLEQEMAGFAVHLLQKK